MIFVAVNAKNIKKLYFSLRQKYQEPSFITLALYSLGPYGVLQEPTEPIVSKALLEGYNWFLNQFVTIPRRSIIVCFLSLVAKAGLNHPPFEMSCS